MSPDTYFVRPARSVDPETGAETALKIVDPETGRRLPDEGDVVPRTLHWFRRIDHGDVVVIDPPPAAEEDVQAPKRRVKE